MHPNLPATPERKFPIAAADRRFSVGLALGGGSARGLAHVVLLEALDELGIRPTVIAGTSMGAIVGSAYAAGLSGREIRAHFEELFERRTGPFRRLQERWPGSLFNLWTPMSGALVNGATFFEIMLPEKVPASFSDLKVPFHVVATDFYAQEEVVLSSGPLMPAVAASSALPGLIKPVELGGRVLIDGGCVNPTPFDLIRGKAAITVAIDVTGLSSNRPDGKLPNAIEGWTGGMQILFRSIVSEKLRTSAPDIMIRPAVGNYAALDFYKCREIFSAAEPSKDELKRELHRRLEQAAVAAADDVMALDPPEKA